MNGSLAVGTTISHYRIVSQIGAGGMGEVYLSQDLTLDRQVALKLLLADVAADSERKRRFLREAKAASALTHPNICVVHEVGETKERQLFIVMEYVEGETLQHKIDRRPLDAVELVMIGLQAADTIDAAHAKGITHRDLKPVNLMITPRGQVKVLDFGLTKVTAPGVHGAAVDAATASNTDPAVVMGTVQYMSPEQALGRDVDHRSDLFSLGVVLYQMATGRLPFAGATASETIDRIMHAQPEAMARFNYALPGELERIVRKCLEKDCERRYQSARELRVDLQNLQRDSNPATGVMAKDVAASWNRKRWAAAAIALTMLAAVAAGFYLRGVQRAGQTIDSVAVLPFANQNHDPETEYLSDGLAESILNNLTNLSELRVIARSSAFKYKGKENDPFTAGHDLGVRAVVTGRVLQRGDNLTISAELVDVRENKQLWGQQYNRKLADVFAVQEDIAKEISEKLRVKLSGSEREHLTKRTTENLKAFQYYMQGRAHTWEIGVYIYGRSFDEALAKLDQATLERKGDPILIYSRGMVYTAQGKRAEALAIIKELEQMSSGSLSQAQWIAKIYSVSNDKEMALTWLERGA